MGLIQMPYCSILVYKYARQGCWNVLDAVPLSVPRGEFYDRRATPLMMRRVEELGDGACPEVLIGSWMSVLV